MLKSLKRLSASIFFLSLNVSPSLEASSGRQILRPVDNVQIERFMGQWYVISHIPTFIERKSYNAVETYSMNEDGQIDVTFTYRKGSFDGPKRKLMPKAFLKKGGKASEWDIQLLWPFWSDYQIIDLDVDYQWTIIGVPSKRYAWIMARKPFMDRDLHRKLVIKLKDSGYNIRKLRIVPHKWD
tara:strand:- start:5 stop:553 length:549 start_codon:yes stop_codon:yes gene_type:complete